jgi:plastocyanin
VITRISGAAAAVLLLAAAACSNQIVPCGRPRTLTTTVHVQAAAFSPANIDINCSTTVRWVNDLAVEHTITPDNASQLGAWPSKVMPATVNSEFVIRLNVPGVYNYHCTIHAGMTGRVTVTTPTEIFGARVVRLLQAVLASVPRATWGTIA